MPGEFIAVADETGIILPINRQLLYDACRQLRSWQELFPSDPPLTVNVNITPKQFAQARPCLSDWQDLAGDWIQSLFSHLGNHGDDCHGGMRTDRPWCCPS